MAFCLLSSFPMCSFPIHSKWKSFSYDRSSSRRLTVFSASQTDATKKTSIEDATITRRSANYHPSIWDYGYVQSLRNDFVQDESYKERANKLKEEVRMMLGNVVDPLEKLELIDALQRLGLSYYFEAEINQTLKNISTDRIGTAAWKKDNLYATALEFRLLRQHGYKVDQDVFTCFLDDVGNIKSSLNQDFKGLLNLYEASYLLLEGETMLENARELAAKLLKQYLKENNDQQYHWMLVGHALELPLHWRMPRLEARWFIDVYGKNKDKNPIILELAILDYNIVQSIHQEDLRNASAWWEELGLGKRFNFARDRLMENFLWSVGMIIAPEDGKSRIFHTMVNALITVIDDVYDVYGTLDELELFTDVVERWDINALQSLPDYMKIFYHALYNSVNEMAFDTLKEQGIDVIPFLKKLWTDLCKAYLVEAKWYYIGYKPTLQEYIDNAWISVGCSLILAHSYLVTDHITEEGLRNIQENYSDIIYGSSLIIRLTNDLGTSSHELKRGDIPKSVQCYMYESGVSEEEAREHIRKLIDATLNHFHPLDVFTCFMDDAGNINSSPNQDFKGLLNLYEASYLLLEGETKLENARELVAELLKQCLKENNDQYLWSLWTMPWSFLYIGGSHGWKPDGSLLHMRKTRTKIPLF